MDANGKRTLIALDEDKAYKLPLDSSAFIWQPLDGPSPQLNYQSYGPSVPFRGSFLILNDKNIWYFNPDSETFELQAETFPSNEDGPDYFAATMVPESYISCT